MSHAYKKTGSPVPEDYRPAQLVKQYGDSWAYLLPQSCAGNTSLAIRDETPDQWDAHIMAQCERGVRARVEE